MSDQLFHLISDACKGLTYISETDAPVEPFKGAKTITANTYDARYPFGIDWGEPVHEVAFGRFFERLTVARDGYGSAETAMAGRYVELQRLLQTNLRQLKVLKVGNIRINIYIVGVSEDGWLTGVKTFAVET